MLIHNVGELADIEHSTQTLDTNSKMPSGLDT